MMRNLGRNADREVDTVRMREGFDLLIDGAKSFPSPAMLYEKMPSRSEGRFARNKCSQFSDISDDEALQIESLTVDQKKEQAIKALDLIGEILGGKTVNSNVIPNEKARRLQVVWDKRR